MKKTGTCIITSMLGMVLLISCNGREELYNRMAKIDTHVHIRTVDPSIMELGIEKGFQFITINTRSNSQEYIDLQMDFARKVDENYPDRIAYITTFSMEGFEEPTWSGDVISRLRMDFKQGAIGVKVWKDIGMTFRDSTGKFILIDDPRFEPVLDFIAKSGKPLVAHIGEPRNCWLPLDSMTVNSDRGYFERNPEYHMYLHPEYPTHEQLMEARDHVLARHPDLNMIGAHLGSLEWDVDELAKRLDLYPNFAVDMAARVCHFQVQNLEKVRNFIISYQDRLLYATDAGFSDEAISDNSLTRMEEVWESDWAYFATEDSLSSSKVNGEFRGLGLSKSILKKIYHSNALHWYPDSF